MSATTKILSKLARLKKTRRGWSARCPAHDDGTASLSVAEGRGGRVLLKCHAGCDLKNIVAALGVEAKDLFDELEDRPATAKKSTPSKPTSKSYKSIVKAHEAYERTLGKPTRSWEYELDGELVGVVLRWDRPDGKKEIRPISRHPDGWRLEHMPEPRPLYGVHLWPLKVRDRVYVVEGEKCVDAVSALGLLAATSSGGSNAAGKTNWSPLAGLDVVILPDNDDAGRKYAGDVAAILHELDPPATVRVVELDGLEPGGDVYDLWAWHSPDLKQELREKIERLADEAVPLKPKASTTSSTPAAPPVEAYRPYPVEALPEPLASFVIETADAIGCDPAYVALPLLTVAGAAIGTTRRLELKAGWTVPAILWSVVVGESGTKKSAPLRSVLEHVNLRERRLREEHRSQLHDHELAVEAYEKQRAAWRAEKKVSTEPPQRPVDPVSRRAVVVETTVEALAFKLADNPRGLLLARDELGGWLGSLDRYAKSGSGGSDEAFFLSSYNGESHAVDRRTGDRREIYVAQAALWITGAIPPAPLRRALGTERRESGLLARLLLTAPPSRVPKWTEKEVSPITRQSLHDTLDWLYGLSPELDGDGREVSRLVRLAPAAKAAYVAWHDRHGEELAGLTGDRAAGWSKLTETAARLALIIQLVRAAGRKPPHKPADEDVDGESMSRALRLIEWHKHETSRVYEILGQTDEETAARQTDDRVAAFVERHGGTVAARDLIAGLRAIPDADAAERALQRLVNAGRGRWIDKPTTERGGRPTRLFELKAEPPSAQPPQPAAKPGSACADALRGAEVEAGEEYVEI